MSEANWRTTTHMSPPETVVSVSYLVMQPSCFMLYETIIKYVPLEFAMVYVHAMLGLLEFLKNKSSSCSKWGISPYIKEEGFVSSPG